MTEVFQLRKGKPKICSICTNQKEREEFPQTNRGTGINEFCSECKDKYKNHSFIMNEGNLVIDALEPEIADQLLLCGVLEFKKKNFYAKDREFYLKYIKGNVDVLIFSPSKILAIGKYNEKRKAVTLETAHKLVEEGAAFWEKDNQIRHTFSGKELQEYIIKRDNGICHFCHDIGDKITFLESRSKGGLLSPKNSVCCCKSCKETNGENLYFYKWLNIPIIEQQQYIPSTNVYTIIDKRNQTSFYIEEEIAKKLVEEEMAILIDKKTIKVLYDKREFRRFIMKRDNYVCFFCGKYGDTIDHLTPQANGGMTTPKNCMCACNKCNEKKGDKEPEAFINKKLNNKIR